MSGALKVSTWLPALVALIVGLTLGRQIPAVSSVSGGETAASTQSQSRRANGSPDPGPRERDPSRSGSSRRKSTTHPATRAGTDLSVVSEILNRGSEVERTRELLDLIDHLDQDELAEVVHNFREAGWVDYNRGEYSLLISAWMDRAPFAALDYFQQSETDGWTRKTAIAAWASEDPAGAAAAIDGLEDEGEVNDWVLGLVKGTARNNPDEALAFVLNQTTGETKEQALREITSEVVIRGLDYSSQWLEQVTEPDLKLDAAKRLAGSLARRNPEAASDWVNTMADPGARAEASAVVSEIYAREDLEGAKDWVIGLPEESVGVAAQNVARYLTRKDPAEAANWLRTLGDAPTLDPARIRFLQEAGRQDPMTALDQVSSLSKAKDQERYYRDILYQWRKRDQEAAVAWASTHSELIPPKVLSSILPKSK